MDLLVVVALLGAYFAGVRGLIEPRYTATAWLTVLGPEAADAAGGTEIPAGPVAAPALPPLTPRVLAEARARSQLAFASPLPGLVVRPIEGANLVLISHEGRRALREALLVNAIADAYVSKYPDRLALFAPAAVPSSPARLGVPAGWLAGALGGALIVAPLGLALSRTLRRRLADPGPIAPAPVPAPAPEPSRS